MDKYDLYLWRDKQRYIVFGMCEAWQEVTSRQG